MNLAARRELARRLRYACGCTIRQIAVEMCITPCTVRQILKRHRKTLEAAGGDCDWREPPKRHVIRGISLSVVQNV